MKTLKLLLSIVFTVMMLSVWGQRTFTQSPTYQSKGSVNSLIKPEFYEEDCAGSFGFNFHLYNIEQEEIDNIQSLTIDFTISHNATEAPNIFSNGSYEVLDSDATSASLRLVLNSNDKNIGNSFVYNPAESSYTIMDFEPKTEFKSDITILIFGYIIPGDFNPPSNTYDYSVDISIDNVSVTSNNFNTVTFVTEDASSACDFIDQINNNENDTDGNKRVIRDYEKTTSVYPNPVSIDLNLNLSEHKQVKLIDLNGKIIFNENIEAGTHKVPVDHLQTGMYILQISNGLQVETHKIIKR